MAFCEHKGSKHPAARMRYSDGRSGVTSILLGYCNKESAYENGPHGEGSVGLMGFRTVERMNFRAKGCSECAMPGGYPRITKGSAFYVASGGILFHFCSLISRAL